MRTFTKEEVDKAMRTLTREQIDEAMKPIWEMKERFYEETKHMTIKERLDYIHQKGREAMREMEERPRGQCDLSFLYEKREDEKQPANDNQNE